MIIGLQIIALVFSVFLIYLAVLNYRRKELNRLELVSWVLIWTTVSFVVLFPNILRDFSKNFLITRLFDLMVVGGFIVVIFIIYVSYVKLKRIEEKLEKYVRKEALDKAKQE